ncbi:MAG TPA: sugar transferase [Rhodopila sp.]|nr:sugar transferase [Rhodopila sp.]
MSALQTIAFQNLDFVTPAAEVAPFSLGDVSGLTVGLPPRQAAVKRVTDVALASLALLLLGVPMVVVAAVMWLQGDGPALFRQQRIGLHNRPFTMLKFRTMRAGAADAAGMCRQATRDDPRVTRLGRFLRRTSFDELPQLLNVLSGEMSLVGPRPHAPGTCAAGRPFETITDRYAQRHCVKPGMTGLAQVRGWRGETDTVEKLLHRVDSDLEYIAMWSLRRDLAIIVRTAVTVLLMRNAY